MNRPVIRWLLYATIFASMTIPRSGTKLGGVPVTAPTLLYLVLLMVWASWSMWRARLDVRGKQFHEQLAVYGVVGFAAVGVVSCAVGLVTSAEPKLWFAEVSALLGFLPLFFLVRTHVRTVDDLQTVIRLVVVALLLVCLYGLAQKVFGHYRVMIPGVTISYADAQQADVFESKYNMTPIGLKVTSTFQNGNLFGSFLALIAPLCVALASVSGLRKRFYYLMLFGLATVALMLTLSRGAVLAGLVSLFALVWMLRPLTIPVFVASGFGALGGVLLYVMQLGERLFNFDPTGAGRIPAYGKLALLYTDLSPGMFALTALFGAGMGGTVGSFSNSIFQVDSSLLIILMKTGILGLLMFLAAVYGVVRCVGVRDGSRITPERAVACGLAAGMIGSVTQYALDSVFMLPPTAMNFWIVAGLAVAANSISRAHSAGQEATT